MLGGCFWPVAPNSGKTSCCARGTILPGFLRAMGSGRLKAKSHSVSDKRQRSSCGLRKWVSMRRAFLTSVICCCPASKRIEYRDSVVAWYSTDHAYSHTPTPRLLLRRVAHSLQRISSA